MLRRLSSFELDVILSHNDVLMQEHRISDIPDEYELTRVASIVVLSVKVTRVSQVVRSLCIPYIVAHIAIKKNATSIDISIPLLMILSF
jgi:hypothetical protein